MKFGHQVAFLKQIVSIGSFKMCNMLYLLSCNIASIYSLTNDLSLISLYSSTNLFIYPTNSFPFHCNTLHDLFSLFFGTFLFPPTLSGALEKPVEFPSGLLKLCHFSAESPGRAAEPDLWQTRRAEAVLEMSSARWRGGSRWR